MRAAVVHEPGAPEVLRLEQRPVPAVRPGWILIRVRAFGINRSEVFTRRGESPGVAFPRILGIEAVGTVEASGDDAFAAGDTVVTAMGGMGRAFDGGYAEYTLAPARQVVRVETTLPWDVLGALPEMLQTAWGSLFTALRLQPGETLLVRGGTTSVGLAAAALAARHGARVVATTRDDARRRRLIDAGASEVIVDTGAIATEVAARIGGADKVLELIGTTTLLDSLRCAKPGGLVCMTGIVGGSWSLREFEPMEHLAGIALTAYAGDVDDVLTTPMQQLIDDVQAGRLALPVARVLALDEIVDAHRLMESNAAGGKIVVVT